MKNFRPGYNSSSLVAISLPLCLGFGLLLYGFYCLFGHHFIESIYNNESIGILNNIIRRRDVHKLEFYLELMDKNAKKFLFLPLLTFYFYFLLYRLYRYLFPHLKSGSSKYMSISSRPLTHEIVVAFCVYLVTLFFIFYPSIRYLGIQLLGPPEDNMKYLWNMWWGYKSLTEPSATLTFTNLIFYPEGTSLLYHDYSWYNLFLSFVLVQFMNGIAAYNILVLHSFALSAIGMFLLSKYLTGNFYASLLAGFIFAFNPSHFAHSLHHINTSSIQFIPFFVLFYLKFMNNFSKINFLLSSLFFFLTTIAYWDYMIFMVFFMVISCVYYIFVQKRPPLNILIKNVNIIALSLLILSPWVLKMLDIAFKKEAVNAYGHNLFVADVLGLFIPYHSHLLGNIGIIAQINRTFSGNPWESTVYLGLVNIGMIICTFPQIIKRSAKYFCGFLAFLILSMGTFVHIMGSTIPIVLPYSLILNIPILSIARAPARNIVFAYLFLSILLAFSLRWIYEYLNRGQYRKYALIPLTLLIFFDFLPVNKDMTRVYLPQCYPVKGGQDDDFAILDLPGGWEESERYMMYQTYHGIPIVQGATPRKIGKSLIDTLEKDDLALQKSQLIENHVKYIMVHKQLLNERKNIEIHKYKETYTVTCEDSESLTLQVY